MRFLCLDLGDRRIGLAISDAGGTLATPLGYIQRTRLQVDIQRVLDHAREREADAIVAGLPISLNGSIGPQARLVEGFIEALREKTELTVDTMDERYSTAEAERLLRQAGRQPSRNKGELDAAAAAVILQAYLDREREANRP